MFSVRLLPADALLFSHQFFGFLAHRRENEGLRFTVEHQGAFGFLAPTPVRTELALTGGCVGDSRVSPRAKVFLVRCLGGSHLVLLKSLDTDFRSGYRLPERPGLAVGHWLFLTKSLACRLFFFLRAFSVVLSSVSLACTSSNRLPRMPWRLARAPCLRSY